MRHRVEFKLSMPGRASWNGGWSGEDKNYVIVREVSDEQLARFLLEPSAREQFLLAPVDIDVTKWCRVWTHRWSDGWLAQVTARLLPAGEESAKSDGFGGYDWMIDNILARGTPYSEVTS